MIRSLLISILALAIISGCSEKNDKVIITGKIFDDSPSEFEYTIPENGVSFFGFKKIIETDSSGSFKISIEAVKPAIIDFTKGFGSYGSLIIEPGKNYEVILGQGKTPPMKVISADSAGQILYNKLKYRNMLTGHFELEARSFSKYGSIDSIVAEIKERKLKELSGFAELRKRKQISSDFLDLVEADRKYYWAGTEGSVAFMNYIMKPRGANRLSENEYSSLWEKVFEDGKETEKALLRSSWFYYFLQNYLRWQELIIDSTETKTLSSYYQAGTIHSHYTAYAKEHLKEPFLEYYRAAYLYYEAVNRNYEKELISLFNDFTGDYPQSLYSGYLIPLIDEIRTFHSKTENVSDEKYRFLSPEGSPDTFSECLKFFSGRKVYIDIWATWCGPCKEEFRLSNDLRTLLKKNNAELLYISIDKTTDRKKWEDMIRFYDLQGSHILASEKLVSDLRVLYGQNGLIAIPWHLIIDENGKIARLHASGPSAPAILEKELADK